VFSGVSHTLHQCFSGATFWCLDSVWSVFRVHVMHCLPWFGVSTHKLLVFQTSGISVKIGISEYAKQF